MNIGQGLHSWYEKIIVFLRRFPQTMRIRPKFSSSFIQSWYCRNWDYDRWLEEYRMLQAIGIQEVILQSISDTKSHFAVYQTNMKGYSSHNVDMLETALSAADRTGMNVRIGLGFNDDWWSVENQDGKWLAREAEANSLIITEVMMMYGGHQSFTGWYIPYEFNPLMVLTHDQQTHLNGFLQKIAGTIKLSSTKSIMIAPYYNARVSGPVTLTFWSHAVRHVLKDTGIDIIALQDSVGAGFNTLRDLDEIFAATKNAADEIGLSLYAVSETFEGNGNKSRPASQSRINEQLFRASPFVREFVAFSINHYQNGNEPVQASGYRDYYRYYFNK
ncbi:DUF4434 domain-containing protein [Desulfosporosinus sp. PR]|uniref:DUF4434 domain-containing protein n=1 Tax=Candidatus Desulfosporosinus nitrosoreducens TaxID=3401928 RepID=UPI0027FA3592|nr:DUF4434 domain-containing protein [Desulfosporosinus sp. PR]MDQ7092239.1 DUF4434 domain-containing protein [Desulfosporosinus sp. PR]